jgi:hypothetical protein
MSEFGRRRRVREERAGAIRAGKLTLKDKDVTLLHTDDPKQRTERAEFEQFVTEYVAGLAA